MNEIVKIEGLYNSENNSLQKCFGEIEIVKIDFAKVYSAYATWRVFTENGQNIASFSKNYFLGDKRLPNYEIFEIVLKNIKNHRIGRKLAFLEIRITDAENNKV